MKESFKKILKVKIYRCFVAIGKQAIQRGRKMKSLKFNQGQRDFELTVEGKFPHNGGFQLLDLIITDVKMPLVGLVEITAFRLESKSCKGFF